MKRNKKSRFNITKTEDFWIILSFISSSLLSVVQSIFSVRPNHNLRSPVYSPSEVDLLNNCDMNDFNKSLRRNENCSMFRYLFQASSEKK